jgi:hypothetical protein
LLGRRTTRDDCLVMSLHPTSDEEKAARNWRSAKGAREAWARFRDWLARVEPDGDGDAPYWVDVHGIHAYGALRSGQVDAPDIAGRKLVIDWFGIDDAWLRRVHLTKRPMATRTIRMKWAEREYWEIIKRFAPGLRDLVGDESFALLEKGMKAEAHAFDDLMAPVLHAKLRASSRHRGRRSHARAGGARSRYRDRL